MDYLHMDMVALQSDCMTFNSWIAGYFKTCIVDCRCKPTQWVWTMRDAEAGLVQVVWAKSPSGCEWRCDCDGGLGRSTHKWPAWAGTHKPTHGAWAANNYAGLVQRLGVPFQVDPYLHNLKKKIFIHPAWANPIGATEQRPGSGSFSAHCKGDSLPHPIKKGGSGLLS